MYNLLIGGAAGQGVDTTADILEKLLKKSGYFVFSTKDLMSRVRGGHNFTLIRFDQAPLYSHTNQLDGIIALNAETVELHKQDLKPDGFILCDEKIPIADPRTLPLKLEETAKKLGNVKASGSVAVGAILKMFTIPLTGIHAMLPALLKPQILAINEAAIQAGYNSVSSRYPHLDGPCADWPLLSGNQAIALGAIAAGLRFYSAYPMSPSTSIMEYLASKMTDAEIVVEQAEDEIAAINMAIGAYFAGARAMTGTSGGGFSLMVEALGLAGMAEIPLVVADIQRPGPVTGLPTRTEQSDLKFVISASQGEFPRMVIAVKHHADAFFQTSRAFYLAEKYQIPVILLSDQYLADAKATIAPLTVDDLPKTYEEAPISSPENYVRYRLTADGISPRAIPGKIQGFVGIDSDEHDERGWITESAEVRNAMMDKRLRKLTKLTEELQEPDFFGSPDAKTLFLGWGSLYGPLKEAVTILKQEYQQNVAALVFGDVYPLPTKKLTAQAANADILVNVEQNATGQLAGLIREQTGLHCTRSILKYDGRQLTGREIAEQWVKEAVK